MSDGDEKLSDKEKEKPKPKERPQVVFDDETLDIFSPKFDPLKAINLPINKRLALPFPSIRPFKKITELPPLEELIAPDIEKARVCVGNDVSGSDIGGPSTSGGGSGNNEPSKYNIGEATNKRRFLPHQGKSINYHF